MKYSNILIVLLSILLPSKTFPFSSRSCIPCSQTHSITRASQKLYTPTILKNNQMLISRNLKETNPQIFMTNTINENDESNKIIKMVTDPNTGLILGLVSLLVILINRLSVSFDLVTDIQSRADIIAVISTSAVLLNAISEQDITTKERSEVALVGYALKSPWIAKDLSSINFEDNIRWIITTCLSSMKLHSVIVISNDMIIGRGGVVSNEEINSMNTMVSSPLNIVNMPILRDVVQSNKELYLPDLQILPGKIEFTYLPVNCQSVLIFPLNSTRTNINAIVFGVNKAKSITISELNKIRILINLYQQNQLLNNNY